MKTWRVLAFSAIAFVANSTMCAGQSASGTLTPGQNACPKSNTQLHRTYTPLPTESVEALEKNLEGKVELCVVVGADGSVTDARVLSGAPELAATALESVKRWRYEPPPEAPAFTTVAIEYSHPKECPGPISDRGAVTASGKLKNEQGELIYAKSDYKLPPYPEEERKAGISGKMTLALSIDQQGRVTRVQVLESLSPRLDALAVETIRTWQFNPAGGDARSLPGKYPLTILFQPTCSPKF